MYRLFKYVLNFISFLLFLANADAQDTVAFPPPVEDVYDTTAVYENTYSTPEEYYGFKEGIPPVKIEGRKIPEDDLNAARADEDYWYVNEAPPKEKRKVREPQKRIRIFDEAWFKTLFWIILIGGFIALLVWFLTTSNISLFRKKLKTVEETNTGEEETENIFEMNFEKEIQKAVSAENFRLAVRLMYLRALRDLSLRNLINYTHEKTNSDYLFQLAGTVYYENFFRLTRNFDYTWYGQFPISKETFSSVQNEFNHFKQQLPR